MGSIRSLFLSVVIGSALGSSASAGTPSTLPDKDTTPQSYYANAHPQADSRTEGALTWSGSETATHDLAKDGAASAVRKIFEALEFDVREKGEAKPFVGRTERSRSLPAVPCSTGEPICVIQCDPAQRARRCPGPPVVALTRLENGISWMSGSAGLPSNEPAICQWIVNNSHC